MHAYAWQPSRELGSGSRIWVIYVTEIGMVTWIMGHLVTWAMTHHFNAVALFLPTLSAQFKFAPQTLSSESQVFTMSVVRATVNFVYYASWLVTKKLLGYIFDIHCVKKKSFFVCLVKAASKLVKQLTLYGILPPSEAIASPQTLPKNCYLPRQV